MGFPDWVWASCGCQFRHERLAVAGRVGDLDRERAPIGWNDRIPDLFLPGPDHVIGLAIDHRLRPDPKRLLLAGQAILHLALTLALNLFPGGTLFIPAFNNRTR